MLNNGGVLTFAAVLALLLAGAGYWSQAAQRARPRPGGRADGGRRTARGEGPAGAATGPLLVAGPDRQGRHPRRRHGLLLGPARRPRSGRSSRPHVGPAPCGARGTSAGAPPPKPRGPRWIGGWVFLAALLAGGLGTGLTWEGAAARHQPADGPRVRARRARPRHRCQRLPGAHGRRLDRPRGDHGGPARRRGRAAQGHQHRTGRARTGSPPRSARVTAQYELGTGVGTLDLSGLDADQGRQTVTTAPRWARASSRCVVPKDATVQAATSRWASATSSCRTTERNDVDMQAWTRTRQVTFDPPAGSKDGGTIELRPRSGHRTGGGDPCYVMSSSPESWSPARPHRDGRALRG